MKVDFLLYCSVKVQRVHYKLKEMGSSEKVGDNFSNL
ncbi:hypothetical protein HMPREF0669_02025 [Prevotella sp. oral taxon 299 str. F0039]|nr:hypothetical protein HMPREF0669_02025 [Prevotella sp. oral taxon 299 str. F0039]